MIFKSPACASARGGKRCDAHVCCQDPNFLALYFSLSNPPVHSNTVASGNSYAKKKGLTLVSSADIVQCCTVWANNNAAYLLSTVLSTQFAEELFGHLLRSTFQIHYIEEEHVQLLSISRHKTRGPTLSKCQICSFPLACLLPSNPVVKSNLPTLHGLLYVFKSII